MKTLTSKCPPSKLSTSQSNHSIPHSNPNETQSDDLDLSTKKPTTLRNISSKLLNNFNEMMYNMAYFQDHDHQNPKQLEEEDDYSEYLMEDYSTFYTDYDQMATFASPPNRQPSLPIKKSSSLNDSRTTLPSSLPNVDLPALAKKDSTVQTDDFSFIKPSNNEDRETSESSSDDMSFFYRLGEAGPKKGVIKNTCVRKIFKPEDMARGYESLSNRGSESPNHLSDSLALSKSHSAPPVMKEEKQSSWKELLDPDHASSVLRLIFNVLIGVALIVVIYSGVMAIRDDFMKKREQENSLAFIEIQQCLRDYTENGCDPSTRRPALEAYCVLKEKCFSQDPAMVVKASKMTASLVAEVLNEFVEPLGLKTMAFFFCLFFGMIMVCNCSLRGDTRRFEVKRNGEIEEINYRLQRVEKLSVERPVIYSEKRNGDMRGRRVCSEKYK